VIDHAQSETDDLLVRHGNPNAKPRIAYRNRPNSATIWHPPEIAAKMDHRASSTSALGLEISE
jgi:hypothetical protein